MFQPSFGQPSGMPSAPPWIGARDADPSTPPYAAPPGYEPANGYSAEQLLKMFPVQTQGQPPVTQAPPPPAQMPPAPPSVRAAKVPSTNPFGSDNLGRTLLDIGSAFLSHNDFLGGLGAAGAAVGARQDALKQNLRKSTEFGGPGGQFEITTSQDGTRTIRRVPEFAQAIAEEQAAKKGLTPKDAVDLKSRVLHGVAQLPPEQRAAAYRDIMVNPEAYGIDTKGMPAAWSDTYGNVAGSMGESVDKANAADLHERQFQHRQAVDTTRTQQRDRALQQGDARVLQGAQRIKRGGRAASAPKPPAGFILD